MSILANIDTRWGSYNSHSYSNGNCLPLTTAPWGMNAFCPQTTDSNGNWFFNPYEPIYQGIRLTHQPSPWLGDFAYMVLTPVTGNLKTNTLFHRQSSYQKDTAIFRPDYLKITSNRYQLTTELTPSIYGANLRLQAENNKPLGLVFYAPGFSSYSINNNKLSIQLIQKLENNEEILSFYIELSFNCSITNLEKLVEDRTENGVEFTGNDLHVRLNLSNSQVEIKLATSYISSQQAQFQLQQKLNFDNAHQQIQKTWTKLLSRVEIKEESPQKDFLYHSLYRTLVFPQTFHEITNTNDTVYFDIHSNKVKLGKYYTNNGYWDTFRTVYPLYSILYPDYYEDFLEGILNHYNDTGFLPKWLSPNERGIMPGTLVDGVIADAISKGFGKRIASELLKALIDTRDKTDKNQRYGRHGSEEYKKLGYLPSHFNESVSHSLDYAYSDWCIGQVANNLGKKQISENMDKLSHSYRQLFDKNTGFIRSKDKNGKFNKHFSPYSWGKDYAECSAFQATLCAYHDFEGLIQLMGGKENFTNYLVELCETPAYFETNNYGYEIHEMSEMAQIKLGQIAISNQPSFHIPYLFQLSNNPEKTQYLIEKIRNLYFSNDFHAYPGDEDNGSLSAWFIFSCLGFYPLCPGKPEYHFGLPAFNEVVLHLPDNSLTIQKILTTSSKNISLDEQTIESLQHKDLMKANKLIFYISKIGG